MEYPPLEDFFRANFTDDEHGARFWVVCHPPMPEDRVIDVSGPGVIIEPRPRGEQRVTLWRISHDEALVATTALANLYTELNPGVANVERVPRVRGKHG